MAKKARRANFETRDVETRINLPFNRTDMNRRELLLGSGIALSTALAGCAGDETSDGNGDDGASEDDNGTSEASSDDPQPDDESDGNGESPDDESNDEQVGSDSDTLLSITETVEGEQPLFDSDPTTFTGSGQKDITDTALGNGFTTIVFEHEGSSDFVVESKSDGHVPIVDENGAVEGATAIVMSPRHTGFEIDADGDWTLHVGQPSAPTEEIRTPPVRASGAGMDLVGPLDLEDSVTVSGEHDGEGYFIVRAYTEDMDQEESMAVTGEPSGELVFNETGTFEGETTIDYPGTVWFGVTADGNWSLEIE